MRPIQPRAALLIAGAALAIGACSEAAPPAPDAMMPRAPAPPALPMLEPCPDGWRAEVDADGVTLCEPWDEGGRVACPEGQHRPPGASACAAPGPRCPDGAWPDDLPSSGVLYVDGASAADGDGTRARPLSTIVSALRLAVAGTTIALARGVYDEAVVLQDGVSIRGACSAETTLRLPSTAAATQTVAVVGSDTALRSVSVTGAGWGLAVQGSRAAVELEGVVIRSVAELAIAVLEGGRVRGRDVAIVLTDTTAAGLEIAGSTLSLESSSVIDPFDVGALTYGAGATCELRGVVVRGTRAAWEGASGSAIVAEESARVEVRRSVIEAHPASGVYLHAGAVGLLEDVLVRDSARVGIEVWSSGITARRVRVARSRLVGVHVRVATAELEDVVIDDGGPSELAGRGAGLLVWESMVRAQRIALRRHHLAGIIGNRSSELAIDDLLIRDVSSEPAELRFGRGITLSRGVRAVVTRARIEGAREYGIAIGEDDTTLTCVDCAVLGTLPQGCFGGACGTTGAGAGIAVASGAALSATDLAIRDSSAIGLQVFEGGAISVSGGEISRQPIGLNLQSEDVDVGRDLVDVRFVDNARNLAREVHPPPEFPEDSVPL